jgi:hypothetical protein
LQQQDNKETAVYQRKLDQSKDQKEQYVLQIEGLFPGLEGFDLPEQKTALPSSYPLAEVSKPEHESWAKTELELRVGMGHDLLDELRQAVGLHSYLIRRSKKARGVKAMKKVSKYQASTSRQKGQIIRDYIQNFDRLNRLLQAGVISMQEQSGALQGLQRLDAKKDAQFFQAWGDQPGEYAEQNGLLISWIWRVAMLSPPGEDKVNDVRAMTKSWESEGTPLCTYDQI